MPQHSLSQFGRRVGRAVVLAAALSAAVAAAPDLGGVAHAACQPASYCRTPGNCLRIPQVSRQAAQRYGGRGWRVESVRLVGHARNATCLQYEVRLRRRDGATRTVFWNVTGGEAR